MPRDGSATRTAILKGALAMLRQTGLSRFAIEGVAAQAGVPKGLVLYHYRSRAGLLETCAATVARERSDRLAAAGAGLSGVARVDALWDELVRQHDDGTTRAWMALVAGVATLPVGDETDVIAQARRTLLDGCAAALATGADRASLREAYDALSLALLSLDESA
jgi:AcrR family transcriptional regulator